MNQATINPVPNPVLDADPTVADQPTDQPTTQSTSYVVMHEVLVDVGRTPARILPLAVEGSLACRAGCPDGGGGGGGFVRWFLVESGKEVGAGLAVGADYQPISSELAVGLVDADATLSGYLDPSISKAPFLLCLAARVSNGIDTLTTFWKTSTTVTVTLDL